MPKIICPECKKSFNIDESDIGKECECPCGNTFKAEAIQESNQKTTQKVKKKTMPEVQKQNRPYIQPLPDAEFPSGGGAFAFRVLGILLLIGGIIGMIAGIKEGESAVLPGISLIAASLPFFAISVVIEALVQIEKNTRRIADYCHSLYINQKK